MHRRRWGKLPVSLLVVGGLALNAFLLAQGCAKVPDMSMSMGTSMGTSMGVSMSAGAGLHCAGKSQCY